VFFNFFEIFQAFLFELECWNIGYSGQNKVWWRMAQAKYTVRPGEQAFAQKLRTGPWQYFVGTTTHRSLPLDETSSNYWVSRSRKDLFFEIPYFEEFCSARPSIVFQKSTKNHQICFCGAVCPAPPPHGAAPLPPTKVGTKCLAAVVLAHHDRVFSPPKNQKKSDRSS